MKFAVKTKDITQRVLLLAALADKFKCDINKRLFDNILTQSDFEHFSWISCYHINNGVSIRLVSSELEDYETLTVDEVCKEFDIKLPNQYSIKHSLI